MMKSLLRVRVTSSPPAPSDVPALKVPLVWQIASLSDAHLTFERSVDWVEYLVRKVSRSSEGAPHGHSTRLVTVRVLVKDDDVELEYKVCHEFTSCQIDALCTLIRRFHCEVTLGWHDIVPADGGRSGEGSASSAWDSFPYRFEHVVLEGGE